MQFTKNPEHPTDLLDKPLVENLVKVEMPDGE